MTIAEALAGFQRDWVDAQPFTPRTSYTRTLRLFVYRLEREGRTAEAPLETLRPADLEAFVAWHASSGLADDADGTRKVALHVARLGGYLAERCGRPDLDLGRDRLRTAAGAQGGATAGR